MSQAKKEDSQQVFEDEPSVQRSHEITGQTHHRGRQGFLHRMGNHLQYHCDFTLASDTAVSVRLDRESASPAGGKIVAYLAEVVGTKKAREMWMLCRKYNAQQALAMGPSMRYILSTKLMQSQRNGPRNCWR